MDGDRRTHGQTRAGQVAFLLGCVLAAVLLGGLAEGYLRLFPPRDLHPYLGERSPLTGPYAPDEAFGLRYRSWEDLRVDNAARLQAFGSLHSHSGQPPIWAFFGNSFVQAPGMLADQARAQVHDHRIFNLGKNEYLEVRLAQVRMLLDNGLEPERLFVELMPPDLIGLGEQPLATLQVTGRGARTFRPRLPSGPVGWLAGHSRLAFTAWCRTGRQVGNPRFDRRTLYQRLDEPLLGDVRYLFGNLAEVARAHQVPVTVLLIPSYHQVAEGASWNFQDTLATAFRQQGLDVFDPRDAFRRHPDPTSLYLPDRHLTPAGNQLLLAELLAHVGKEKEEVGRRKEEKKVARLPNPQGAAGEPEKPFLHPSSFTLHP